MSNFHSHSTIGTISSGFSLFELTFSQYLNRIVRCLLQGRLYIPPLADNCVSLRVQDDAVIADGGGYHGQGQEDEADDVAQEIILIVIDVRKEEVIEHAPQTSPDVHRGKETEQDGEHIEGLVHVELGAGGAGVLMQVIQAVGHDVGAVAHEQ